MITLQEAKSKFQSTIGKHLSTEAQGTLLEALEQKRIITREDTYLDRASLEYMGWVESRLAQHKYLAEDQSNGLWGQSTTKALELLAKVYKIDFKGALDSNIVHALIDGQRSPKDIISKPNSYEWLKAMVLKAGYRWEYGAGFINIIGIRGYVVPAGKVANLPNIWNDTIFIAGQDFNGKPFVTPFLASCDPGRYYYQVKRLNPAGCASLQAGQWRWKRGTHISYPALVQTVEPFTVHRIDRSGQQKSTDTLQRGYFGINNHAGTETITVDFASAGCQVVYSNGPNGWQWRKYWGIVNSARNTVFNYSLFDEAPS